MAKMLRIERCCDCKFCEGNATIHGECSHPNSNRRLIVPSASVHMFCPLPDAESAPYSESNLPKVRDYVKLWGDVGIITSRVGSGNETEYFVACVIWRGRWHKPKELTLLYRPPQGDSK